MERLGNLLNGRSRLKTDTLSRTSVFSDYSGQEMEFEFKARFGVSDSSNTTRNRGRSCSRVGGLGKQGKAGNALEAGPCSAS